LKWLKEAFQAEQQYRGALSARRWINLVYKMWDAPDVLSMYHDQILDMAHGDDKVKKEWLWWYIEEMKTSSCFLIRLLHQSLINLRKRIIKIPAVGLVRTAPLVQAQAGFAAGLHCLQGADQRVQVPALLLTLLCQRDQLLVVIHIRFPFQKIEQRSLCGGCAVCMRTLFVRTSIIDANFIVVKSLFRYYHLHYSPDFQFSVE